MDPILDIVNSNIPNFIGFAILARVLSRQIDAMRKDMNESNKFMQQIIMLLLQDSDVSPAVQKLAVSRQPDDPNRNP